MNGLNSLENPTINGLKNLVLDQLDANIINSNGITFFEDLETTNIIVDNQLILNPDASIYANSLVISDLELSYIFGGTSNFQSQINNIGSNLTTVLGRTQNMSTIENETTFFGNIKLNSGSIIANGNNISDIELSYLDGATSNIQSQLTSLQGKTQNFAASAGLTTSLGNISFNPGLGLLVNTKFISDIELSYLDGATSNIQQQIDSFGQNSAVIGINSEKLQNQSAVFFETSYEGNITADSVTIRTGGQLLFGDSYQDDAFTSLEKTKLSWLNITETELLINQISFIDDLEVGVQRTAFTSTLKSLIETVDEKTTNISLEGDITTISGTLYTPYLSVGNEMYFPDDTIQATAYIQPILTQYSATTSEFLGSLINDAGEWYNFNNTWVPSAYYLTQGFYTINLMVTLGDINELQRIESHILITRSGTTIDQSYNSGIYLQSGTAQREQYSYNLQFLFKSEHATNELKVYTTIHMKARSTSYCTGRIQILKQ